MEAVCHCWRCQKHRSLAEQRARIARDTDATGGVATCRCRACESQREARRMDWMPEKQYQQEQKGLKKAKASRKKNDASARRVIGQLPPGKPVGFDDTPVSESPHHPINPLKIKPPKGKAPAPGKSIGAIKVAPSQTAAATTGNAPAGGGAAAAGAAMKDRRAT